MSIDLRSPFKQPPRDANSLLLSRHHNYSVKELRLWRRRRFKIKPTTAAPNLLVRSHFGNFITDFVSRFPSVDTAAPALGLASGLALYIHKLNSTKQTDNDNDDDDGGEWMLFATPSPFTRFALLRCPSLCFLGQGDVNEKLLKEDRHSVGFDRSGVYGARKVVEGLEYQRLCVPTDDGGVIALDLPAHLNLGEEDGLDTTLLLVPGSTEGSMDKNVQLFVSESLKRGCFPVVLNPRGCAGSPLTTSRMFTAADSDDVCKAVQFISKMRPRTTIMGVGWGYGANMLTKYLAEVGDKTPLLAATCFDNPFYLPNGPKTFQQNHADQKLLNGFKNILRSNKEIFQGKKKGFEVEKALLAESVREFESFISMISYGFQTIEDFYTECSTHYVVKDIKVPVLFIQSDNEIQQLFYAPHGSIAQNPFTSHLICSSLPSNLVDGSGSAVLWCQYLTIEWLGAVELGLLKGYHPLTEDVNVSLCLLGGKGFNEGVKAKLLDYGQKEFSNDCRMDPTSEMLDQNAVTTTSSKPGVHSQTYSGHGNTSLLQTNSAKVVEENSVQASSMNADEGSEVENDKGQVLQTAHLVLNMLEVSMPGTFAPEQKEKVLTAVSKGATVLNALQDAVPEDAREKLTTTVSEILSTGMNLKLDGLLNRGQKSITLSDPESGVLGKGEGKSDVDGSSSQNSINGAVHLEEHESSNNVLGNKQQTGLNDLQHPGEAGNGVESQFIDDHVDQDAVPEGIVGSMEGVRESPVKDEVAHLDHNETPAYSDHMEKGNVNGDETSLCDSALGNKEPTVDQSPGNEFHETPQLASEEENNAPNIEEKDKDSADASKIEFPAETGQAVSSTKSDPVNDVRREAKDVGTQLMQENGKPGVSNDDPASIKVSEAFDALASMDDSTQVAVNSVFGVIEGVITQLEEKTDNEKDIENIQDVDGEKPLHAIDHSPDIEEKGNIIKQQNPETKDSPRYDCSGDSLESHHKIMTEKVDEKIVPSCPQGEKPHHVIYNSPDIKVKGSNINQQNDQIKDSSKSNYSGDSLESHHRIMNEQVGKRIVQHPSRGDKDPSWSYSAHLGNKEKDNDQVNSSNLSCTLPGRATTMYTGPLHNSEKHTLSSLQNIGVLDMNTNTSEEGKWNLLEQSGTSSDFDKSNRSRANGFAGLEKSTDTDLQQEDAVIDNECPEKDVDVPDKENDIHMVGETKRESMHDLDHMVKRTIKDSIEAEILCRLSETDVKEISHSLAKDMELVSNVITQAVRENMICGNLDAGHIVKAISFAVPKTIYLRRILPIGVMVGSSLTVLKKHFNVINGSNGETKDDCKLSYGLQVENNVNEKNNGNDFFQASERQRLDVSESIHTEKNDSEKDSVMVGAATAAVCASALLMQDSYMDEENTEPIATSLKKKEYKEVEIPETQSNLVSSIADKAMSVAGPVVPKMENGAVDQERIVSMLANLGQNGGILKLVSKAALLWGGLRGAMSLTHKLISFLHLSERPLFQRWLSLARFPNDMGQIRVSRYIYLAKIGRTLIGFGGLVILLWSPVYIPLLPTLVRGWATKSPSKSAELSCIIGLYVAVTILIALWGKRICGYERPLKQYGLDFTLPMFKTFMTAYVGGALIVLSIQYVNMVIGCASVSLETCMPFVSSTRLPEFGKILLLVAQGTVSATGVALVEELLFRSWLPAEVSEEFGFQVGIIVAGLTFSVFQRSLSAIPGLWLLSLALSGAKERSQGSLSTPIGLRAGMMATTYVMQKMGVLTYQYKVPLWFNVTDPVQPVSGITGLAFSFLLAIYLYPRPSDNGIKAARKIRE